MGVPREVRRGDVTRPAPGVSFPKLPEVGGKMLRRRRKNRGRYARDTRRFGQLGGFPRECLIPEVAEKLAGTRWREGGERHHRGGKIAGILKKPQEGGFDETVVRGVIFPPGRREGGKGR